MLLVLLWLRFAFRRPAEYVLAESDSARKGGTYSTGTRGSINARC